METVKSLKVENYYYRFLLRVENVFSFLFLSHVRASNDFCIFIRVTVRWISYKTVIDKNREIRENIITRDLFVYLSHSGRRVLRGYIRLCKQVFMNDDCMTSLSTLREDRLR